MRRCTDESSPKSGTLTAASPKGGVAYRYNHLHADGGAKCCNAESVSRTDPEVEDALGTCRSLYWTAALVHIDKQWQGSYLDILSGFDSHFLGKYVEMCRQTLSREEWVSVRSQSFGGRRSLAEPRTQELETQPQLSETLLMCFRS